MKLIIRILAYNWKYYAFAVLVFVVFWHIFSVTNIVSTADDKLLTAMHQNAVRFEKSFLKSDVIEAQKILWQIKNEHVKLIRFVPHGDEKKKWIFKEIIVGKLSTRKWGQRIRMKPLISNGTELGNLEYVIDLLDLNRSVFIQNYALFITVVMFFLGLLVLSNMGAIKTIFSIERCVDETHSLVDAGGHEGIQNAIQRSIQTLPTSLISSPFASLIGRLAKVLQQASHLESELVVSKAISTLATQVAHDIRSPLSALDSLMKDISQLPEEKRHIARSAVGRIRDIANNLLENYRQEPTTGHSATVKGVTPANTEPATVYMLFGLIDPVITEKRLQFHSRIGVEIDSQLGTAFYGLFAKIQPVEFQRLLSNLINNGVEALNKTGSVIVSATHGNTNISIRVQDTGKGIPREILSKLGQRGKTHGKSGGSGLGLYHARICIESWGGSLDIESEPGKGTIVTVNLPKASPPSWFVSELELNPAIPVVILDDDTLIHQVWQGRFDSLRIKESNVETLHFSAPGDFRKWVRTNPAKAGNALYLLDYELLGHRETGLSLAEELDIGAQTILVTGRSDEKQILEDCLRLKVRMIPKGLAGLVPISVQADLEELDAVLVDDDPLVHMTWKVAAKAKGHNLSVFKDAGAFLAKAGKFRKETVIYLDSDLGDGKTGEDLAKELQSLGFVNLYLETGHPAESFKHLGFVKKVVGKEPPWT